MDSHAIHDTGGLFENTEVIELCQSVINIHQVLRSLCLLLDDFKEVHTTTGTMTYDFQRWGIGKVGEMFIDDQTAKLGRIMEIYSEESQRLNEKTQSGSIQGG